jgi:hypothetical protein
MRHSWRIAILVLLLFSAAASAAVYRRLNFDALVQGSDLVVYGRVIGSQAIGDPATGIIWTRTQIRVLEGAKGKPGSTVMITEPGGVFNGRGQLYPGTPQFSPNQEVVVFLYRAPGDRFRVTGSVQGLFAVQTTDATGDRKVRSIAARSEIAVESGSSYQRSQESSESFPEALNRFLAAVREKAAGR